MSRVQFHHVTWHFKWKLFLQRFPDDFVTGNLAWLFGNSKEAPAGAVLRAAFWMCTKIGTALHRHMAGQGATAFEQQENG